jgi:hypothetical protein
MVLGEYDLSRTAYADADPAFWDELYEQFDESGTAFTYEDIASLL